MINQSPRCGAMLSLLGAGALLAASAAQAAEAEKSFEIYGFAMADYIQDFQRVDPSWEDAFRPSKIPTTEGIYGTDGQSSLSVKQSRFGVKGTMPTGEGSQPIKFKFEFDLFGTGVDAGQTTFRLRHMYGEWGQFLAGQTHSLFMDIDNFPNVIDYWGPAGMVFYRNVQIRWTPYDTGKSSFALAIERPGNDIDAGRIREIDPNLGSSIKADDSLPDLTAHYRMDGDWGHLQLAGILRKVGAEVAASGTTPARSTSETGWGINATTSIKVLEKDLIHLAVVYGQGIASYMNDGGTDLAPTAAPNTLQAKAVPLIGVMAYWDHWWSPKLSSSFGYSFHDQDNTNFQSANAMDRIDYASANLLFYPAQKVMVGAEVMWGQRKDKNGAKGDDTRIQVSFKYDFGTKL